MDTDPSKEIGGGTTRYWVVGLCLPALITLPFILTAPIWWRKDTLVTRILSFSWAALFSVSAVGIAAAFVVTILASARKKWRLQTALVMWALVLEAIGAIAYNLHVIAGE